MNLLGFPCRFSTIQKKPPNLNNHRAESEAKSELSLWWFRRGHQVDRTKNTPTLKSGAWISTTIKSATRTCGYLWNQIPCKSFQKEKHNPTFVVEGCCVFGFGRVCVLVHHTPPQMTLRPPDHDHPIPWLWAFHGSHQGNGAKRHCRTINQSTEDSRDEIWPLRTVVNLWEFWTRIIPVIM